MVSAGVFAGSWNLAHAQLVTPKTVPVQQDNQFAIFPSQRFGMANVGIALDDTLADPFGNPARATRVRQSLVFTVPFAHGIRNGRGGGSTFPGGGFATWRDWTVGAVAAVQQLNEGGGFTQGATRTAHNAYGSAVLAKHLGNGLSVGGSAYLAGLNAVDGVDLLYQGSDRLDQSGTLSDFRVGLVKEWTRQRFDAVIVHNRTNMTQDVHFTNRIGRPDGSIVVTTSDDHNIDKTLIWGAHTQYVAAVGTDGWRVGVVATGNRLSHPKIPNYRIQNIPRDPGTTWSANLGVGVARAIGGFSFGVDYVNEPMRSHTWGLAERDTAMADGGVLRAGDRTVTNKFSFANSRVRIGVGRDIAVSDSGDKLGFQFGMMVYSIDYNLHQTNHVQQNERWLGEGWTEVSPTLGFQWRAKDFSFQYAYRLTCGPNACTLGGDKITVPPSSTGGVIAAPASPLTTSAGSSRTHRFLLSVPIR